MGLSSETIGSQPVIPNGAPVAGKVVISNEGHLWHMTQGQDKSSSTISMQTEPGNIRITQNADGKLEAQSLKADGTADKSATIAEGQVVMVNGQHGGHDYYETGKNGTLTQIQAQEAVNIVMSSAPNAKGQNGPSIA